MRGQRVIIKAKRPAGQFRYDYNLENTKGTIVADFREPNTPCFGEMDGAIIKCDVDNSCWAFKPTEYEVIKEEVDEDFPEEEW